MKPKIIKNETDYESALAYLETLMDALPGTPEEEDLELFAVLIEKYEQKHFPIGLPDPVEAIKFRMEQQGLSRKDLIPYIGSQSKVSEVLNGKRPLSKSMIRALHEELGIPAEVLLQEPGRQIKPCEFNPKDYPFKEMVKAGYFPGVISLAKAKGQAEELLERLLSPLKTSQIQRVYCRNSTLIPPAYQLQKSPINVSVAERQENYGVAEENQIALRQINENALIAWQARVLQISEEQKLPAFSNDQITETYLRNIVKLSVFPNGPILAQKVLHTNGIHFVVLQHLPQTYLDGACFKAPSGRPVIGMTIRQDRLDNFWFTLLHELSHVFLHLVNNDYAFFDDTEYGISHPCNPQEIEANGLCIDLLIPKAIWKKEKEKLINTRDDNLIKAFANRVGISPAIVAGRIRWETGDYALFTQLVGNRTVRKLFSSQD